jgi:protein involved in polysaccharide export with SLBB domain
MKLHNYIIFVALSILTLLVGCTGTSVTTQMEQSSANKYVYVGGEFNNTGRFPWKPGMTLQDAIGLANGFTGYSIPGLLYIVHNDGSRVEFRIESGSSFTNNATLSPGDQVIIERTPF